MTAISNEDYTRQLLDLITLDRVGDDDFVGSPMPLHLRSVNKRMFGGQVMAQALIAAEATLPRPRPPASFHCRFVRPGAVDHQIEARISRDIDGKTVSHRRVEVNQLGKPIFTASIMYHEPTASDVFHQPPMPDVPSGEACYARMLEQQRAAAEADTYRSFLYTKPPFLVAPVDPAQWTTTEPADEPCRVWIRIDGRIGDDPAYHRALLAYISDTTMLRACDVRHGLNWFRGELIQASLDHAIWFHDDFRMDEWLLHCTYSDWAGRGRGLARGHVFTSDGRLVASTSQEGMVNVVKRPG